MDRRIKLLKPHIVLGNRVHAKGDVVDVDEDTFIRLVKNDKNAVECDEELTVFPEPETAVDEPPTPPENGGNEKATGRSGNRR